MNKIMRWLWHSLLAILLVGVLPGLLQPQTASAADDRVLDQSQPLQNMSGMVGSSDGPYLGEVFTAGLSGILDRVRLVLENYAPDPANGPVNVSIRAVTEDGLPSDEEIGSGTIPLSAIPPAGSPAWADVLLISPAKVTAGSQYALLLETTTTGGSSIILWHNFGGQDFKPYPRGYQVVRFSWGWEKILTNQDWTFETYVWPTSLDQSQTAVPNYYGHFGDGQRLAQTFTAGLYGMLDGVSLELENYSDNPTNGPVTVEIYPVSGGYPFGFPIGSGLIPLSAIPPFPGPAWVDVSLSDTYVTPGSQYAIVLSTSDGGWVRWAANNNPGSYPGGNMLIGYPGGSWSTETYDMAFKTYVMPSSVDAAQVGINRWDAFFDGEPRAQTFTVSRSGVLDRVSVYLGYPATWIYTPTGPINVSIQTLTSTGAPSGTQIASGTIPASDLVSSGSWVLAELTPVYVTAGTQYALVLSTNDYGVFIDWFTQYPYPYPEGVLWWFESGRGWTTYGLETEDAAFQAYVTPAAARASLPGSATATSTSLISSANPSVVDQPVTYTAAVSPVPDGGTILFQDKGTDIDGCSAVAVDTAGEASCSAIHVDPGSEAITASYSGDGDFAPSYAALSQEVQYAVGLLYRPREKGKSGSTIPIKIELMNFSRQNISTREVSVQALCVVASPTPGDDPCASAPSGFNWSIGTPRYFTYHPAKGRGGSYQFNVKTTGLGVGTGGKTYQILFRATGEPLTVYHADAGVTFKLTK